MVVVVVRGGGDGGDGGERRWLSPLSSVGTNVVVVVRGVVRGVKFEFGTSTYM